MTIYCENILDTFDPSNGWQGAKQGEVREGISNFLSSGQIHDAVVGRQTLSHDLDSLLQKERELRHGNEQS